MIPVPQRTDDDCFRCCVASLLELSYEDVPHFFDYEGADAAPGLAALQAWLLARHGLYYFQTAVLAADLASREGQMFLPGHHVLIGRGMGLPESAHAVVAHRGRVVFDPSRRPHTFTTFADLTYLVGVLCRA